MESLNVLIPLVLIVEYFAQYLQQHFRFLSSALQVSEKNSGKTVGFVFFSACLFLNTFAKMENTQEWIS